MSDQVLIGAEEAMRRALGSLNEAADMEPDHYRCEAGAALMALASHGYAVISFSQHANALQALRFIQGPSDSGALIEVYREDGGGYEGLQAVARYALGGSAMSKSVSSHQAERYVPESPGVSASLFEAERERYEQAIKELESARDQLAARIHGAVAMLNAIVMPPSEAGAAKRILTGEEGTER